MRRSQEVEDKHDDSYSLIELEKISEIIEESLSDYFKRIQ
jgi:hypothetical protein